LKLLDLLRRKGTDVMLPPEPPAAVPPPPPSVTPADRATTRREAAHARAVFRKFDEVVADYRRQDAVLRASHK
jgi:hypothetical protein